MPGKASLLPTTALYRLIPQALRPYPRGQARAIHVDRPPQAKKPAPKGRRTATPPPPPPPPRRLVHRHVPEAPIRDATFHDVDLPLFSVPSKITTIAEGGARVIRAKHAPRSRRQQPSNIPSPSPADEDGISMPDRDPYRTPEDVQEGVSDPYASPPQPIPHPPEMDAHLMLGLQYAAESIERTYRAPHRPGNRTLPPLGAPPLLISPATDPSYDRVHDLIRSLRPYAPPSVSRSLYRTLLALPRTTRAKSLVQTAVVRFHRQGYPWYAEGLMAWGREGDVSGVAIDIISRKKRLFDQTAAQPSIAHLLHEYRRLMRTPADFTVSARTQFLRSFARSARLEEAQMVMREMWRDGLTPNPHSWASLLHAHSRAQDSAGLWKVFITMLRAHVPITAITIAVLLPGLAQDGDLPKIMFMERILIQRNLVLEHPAILTDALVHAAARRGDIVRALRYEARSYAQGHMIGNGARVSLFRALAWASRPPASPRRRFKEREWRSMIDPARGGLDLPAELRSLFTRWHSQGWLQDRHVIAGFVGAFDRTGDIEWGKRAYALLPNPTLQALTSYIGLLGRAEDWEAVRKETERAIVQAPRLDEAFYVHVTSAAAGVGLPSAIAWSLRTARSMLGTAAPPSRCLDAAIWGAARAAHLPAVLGYWRASLAAGYTTSDFALIWLWKAYTFAEVGEYASAIQWGDEARKVAYWMGPLQEVKEAASYHLHEAMDRLGDELIEYSNSKEFARVNDWTYKESRASLSRSPALHDSPQHQATTHAYSPALNGNIYGVYQEQGQDERWEPSYHQKRGFLRPSLPRHSQRLLRFLNHRSFRREISRTCTYLEHTISPALMQSVMAPRGPYVSYDAEGNWQGMPIPSPLLLWRTLLAAGAKPSATVCEIAVTAMVRWSSDMGFREVSMYMTAHRLHIPRHIRQAFFRDRYAQDPGRSSRR